MPKEPFQRLAAPRRNRIIAVAVEEFARHSFANASLSRMVRSAGIAKGSVYQYFDNKLDLYRWLVSIHAPAAREALHAAHSRRTAHFFERMESHFLADLLFFAESPALAHLLFNARQPTAEPELTEIHEAGFTGLHRELAMVVEAALSNGELRVDVERSVVIALLLGLSGANLERILLERIRLPLADALAEQTLTNRCGLLQLRSLAFDLIDGIKWGVGRPPSARRRDKR